MEMNKATKSKVLIFSIIALLILIFILLVVSQAKKKDKPEEEVNLYTSESSFTLDDMMKINEAGSNGVTSPQLLSDTEFSESPLEEDNQSGELYEQADEEVVLLQQLLKESQDVKVKSDAVPQGVVSHTPLETPQKTAIIDTPPVTIPDILIIEQEMEDVPKRNRFYRGEKEREVGNAVETVVHGEQTIMNKGTLKLRLLEDIYLIEENITISRGTYVYGVATITQERIEIKIENVRIGKNIIPLKREVYDMDGLKGISVPDNVKAELSKTASSQVVQDQNSNLNNTGAVGRTISAVGTATKSVLTAAIQEVKVTIKSNYKVYLK